MTQPIAIDLFCGLGGWTEGLLAEGYYVVGFDIERHEYGDEKYPGQLVLQDVATIHGRQFKDADLIVASPPCQRYSYMAMPWTKAKQLAREYRDGTRSIAELNALFDHCFRIQREAIEAAGHHIPLVVENVRGAQAWVGRSAWNYGSFHLWGDVPALMPIVAKHCKVPKFRFDGSGKSFQTASVEHTGVKVPGLDWNRFKNGDPNYRGQAFNSHAARAIKNSGGSWFKVAHNTTSGKGKNPDGRHWKRDPVASCGSRSKKRAHASALIAKIPLALSTHIARAWKPQAVAA